MGPVGEPGRKGSCGRVSPPGVEPGLRPSQGRVHPPHPEDKVTRDAGGSRTHFHGFADRRLAIWLQRHEHPRQESNLVPGLRRARCVRHTPRTTSIPTWSRTRIQTLGPSDVVCYTTGTRRADDWIRTSMLRLTRAAPFSVEPRRHKQERKESNLVERIWRPPALPGAHSYRGQGVRGESNPPLRRSQRRVPHRYTTDTINPPLAPRGRGGVRGESGRSGS